ncbi:hypothetical protein HY837_01455 [archaeon]|nr:hypothetical protein [archaeon]
MYDVKETDLSFEYLQKIFELSKNIKIAVLGGWAVYFYVNEEYKKAFGADYLKSRDIDLFIPQIQEKEFNEVLKRLHFQKSAYTFRYELIYDRTRKEIINYDKSKKIPIYDLVFIFLDLFSDKKTKIIGSWSMKELEETKIIRKQEIFMLDINTLLLLKCNSFFEREKLDKEYKDACDIYALLFYSGQNFKLTKNVTEACKKILQRDDLQEFIADNVLRDSLKKSLVRRDVDKLIS